MTDLEVYAEAAMLGAAAGMRSFSSPALVSHMAGNGMMPVHNAPLQWLAYPASAKVLATLAVGEVIADKLPAVPNRTDIGPVVARAISGAMSGAAVASSKRRVVLLGACIGACAAVGSTFAAYHLRRSAGEQTGLPDTLWALVEDAVVAASGWLVYQSLQNDRART